jgi:hypothetical protein
MADSYPTSYCLEIFIPYYQSFCNHFKKCTNKLNQLQTRLLYIYS